jgi:hypothetical protein
MKKNEKIAKKRKEREKKSHTKVLLRREAIRKERREIVRQNLLEKSLSPKKTPIVNNRELQLDQEAKKTEKIKEQLLKNQEILKALEEQYNQEQDIRKQINENLESEGNMSLQDKLSAMHKSVIDSQEKFQDPDAQIVIDYENK